MYYENNAVIFSVTVYLELDIPWTTFSFIIPD